MVVVVEDGKTRIELDTGIVRTVRSRRDHVIVAQAPTIICAFRRAEHRPGQLGQVNSVPSVHPPQAVLRTRRQASAENRFK